MVIDVTGSMGHIIRQVKSAALNFHEQLSLRMADKGKHVAKLRVRTVAFRDMFADQECFIESRFFELPQEHTEFADFVGSLKAKGGGGDGPESGLEGLSLAMHSDWTKDGDKRRHVIILWSDARPHPLEKGSGNVPATLNGRVCQSFGDLTDEWETGQKCGMERSTRRFVLYAPEVRGWNELVESWSQTIHFPSKAGKGLREFEMNTILDALANSI
jgi:hypothetical protein